jgi:ribonuclease HI
MAAANRIRAREPGPPCCNAPAKCAKLVGGETRTTNNRMELMAAIMSLESLERPAAWTSTRFRLSEEPHHKLDPRWKRNGWKPHKKAGPERRPLAPPGHGEPAPRSEVALDPGSRRRPLNERCDQLCGEEIRRLRKAGGKAGHTAGRHCGGACPPFPNSDFRNPKAPYRP